MKHSAIIPLVISFGFTQIGVWAMQDNDIPKTAPQDSIMASAAEVQSVQGWAGAAFAGLVAQPGAIPIEVRRQDHSTLHFGRSCLGTPLRIGTEDFRHGLGTHANSELVIGVPANARAFAASVGIDHNYDTNGQRGSVQFSVELAGKEVFRTPTLRGSDGPTRVEVSLPAGTTEIVLKVDATPDGAGWDQADWADARFLLADGSVRYLDEGRADSLLPVPVPPFSFVYGGKPSSEFLASWPRTVETSEDAEAVRHTVRWTDPQTGLEVRAEAKVFRGYPAMDWVLHFTNTGTADTPIIEQVQALDLRLRTDAARRPLTIHQLEGDACGEKSFTPFATAVATKRSCRLAPSGGRPSNTTAFPFFNLEFEGQGLLVAVGWSGQWAASFTRDDSGTTRLAAGMELTHLLLHPGESIRTPRILAMTWQGSREDAHNRWRRLLLFHYMPRQDGRPARMPVALQCFDRYSWTRAEWATEAGQIAAVTAAKELGFDHHWLDAAWFPGGFPHGVGNWEAKPQEFPNGLKPVSDACRAQGLKFILWFEPERVAKGSRIAEEHPEFVFGGKDGGLYKLNDPAARRFLTDLLSRRIGEYGLDIYRNDFNIDPLHFWRANDTADRQGITEIRYVEGHYAMWDELLAAHPGLQIDNCASGGRRIDLETGMRSLPLWRSDTSCSPGHPEWNQLQTVGLSQFIPFHTACAWTPEPYDLRSAATCGLIAQFDYLAPGFPMDLAKASIAEAKEIQKYLYGDLYALSGVSARPEDFVAYQFHRADLDEGLILAFRHGESRTAGLIVGLPAVDPAQTYALEFSDEARTITRRTATGRELADGLELRIPRPGASLLVRYRPAGR